MAFETKIEVGKCHIDQLNHLNHVETVRFLERSRSDWLQMCGLDTVGIETVDGSPRYGSVVVNINYNYRDQCMVGDRLIITTQPEFLGNKSYRLHHKIIRPNGSLALEGTATSVIMDLSTRAIIKVPTCIARHFPHISS